VSPRAEAAPPESSPAAGVVEVRRKVVEATGGSSKRAGAGSAATAPRPAASPRHKVRGKQRGEEGAAQLRRLEGEVGARGGSGGRERWRGGGGAGS
jgi:hypothetical protein